MPHKESKPLRMVFEDNALMAELCGHHDGHLTQLEKALDIQIVSRGNKIAIFGSLDQAKKAKVVLEDLYELLEEGEEVDSDKVDAALRILDGNMIEDTRPNDVLGKHAMIKTPLKNIAPRTVQQHAYFNALKNNKLVFGVGPAGTGKTYLATAFAVYLLMSKQVKRIILTRPVVEAGESLGFLPGTLEEKIDPYLRPLFDVLNDTVGPEKSKELMESGAIEIAPLAYMRGRTLNHCVMLLDEAQNTTTMQMRMFLTRMGEKSHMIVTGDPTQCDLKPNQVSGLREAMSVLDGVKDIEVVRFKNEDVVRHALVQRIVDAYDQQDRQIDLKLDADYTW